MSAVDSESPAHAKLMEQIKELFSELKSLLATEIPGSRPGRLQAPFYSAGTPWSPEDEVRIKPDFQFFVDEEVATKTHPFQNSCVFVGEFAYIQPASALEEKCIQWGTEYKVSYVVAIKLWKGTATMSVWLFEDGVKQPAAQTVSLRTEERGQSIVLSFEFKEILFRYVDLSFMNKFDCIPSRFAVTIEIRSWES